MHLQRVGFTAFLTLIATLAINDFPLIQHLTSPTLQEQKSLQLFLPYPLNRPGQGKMIRKSIYSWPPESTEGSSPGDRGWAILNFQVLAQTPADLKVQAYQRF